MSESKELAKLRFDISEAESQLKTLDKAFKEFGKGSKNVLVDQAKTNNKIILEDAKKNNKIEIQNSKTYNKLVELEGKVEAANKVTNQKIILEDAKKNNKIEVQNNQHANRMEEIFAREANSAKSMWASIQNAANAYLGAQGLLMLKQAATELVQEMTDVEYKMIEIDRVLNENSLDIDKYRDQLIQLAYDYGNSFENVSDVAARLSKAGFNSNEVLQLTEKTLLALNTAELDATQATEDMIAVMSQWGLMTGNAEKEAEDYAAIIDRINNVADRFPTTSADLLEALKKTSTAFKLNNVEIDEAIALITTAEIATQRGGKVIGTAMNSIIQQMFTTKRIATMEGLGIDVYANETKTEFNSLIDIMTQLSEKMQQLKTDGRENSTEMKNLMEVFSVLRRNIGSGLLSGIAGEDSNYAEVLKVSMNSLGYSIEENKKHMESAKAAIAQFNAELLKLKVEIWDNGGEDVFKAIILLGEEVINIFKELVIILGKSETGIKTLVDILGKLTEVLRTVKEGIQYTREALSKFNEKVNEIYENGGMLAKAIDAVRGSSEAWEGVLRKMFSAMNPVLIALPDFPNLLEHTEKQEEETAEATETLDEALAKIAEDQEATISGFSSLNNILKSSLEQMDSYADKYQILEAAVSEFNTAGQITSATMQNLVNNNLLQFLDLTADKATVNKDAFLNYGEALKIQAIEALQAAAANDINKAALGDVESMSDIAKAAIAQFGNNAVITGNKAATAAGQIEVMAKSLQDAHNAALGNLGEGVSKSTFEKQSQAIIKQYTTYAKQIASLDISSPLYKGSSSGKSGGSAKQATKTFEEESQKRVKIFKKEIDELESLEKSWVNKYKKLELFSTNDLKFITHQRINRYNEYLNQINQLTGITEADRTSLIQEYSSKRQEAELEYFDLLKKQLDDQISDLKEANKQKIQAIKDEAKAQIDALKKIEDENDRVKQKEEYDRKRNELIYGHQGIEYWRQRTGREAQLALQEAEDKLRDLDEDWNEKKEGWTLEDQIEEIETARDAQIKAIEDAQDAQIAGWQAAYTAQIQMYAQTGQIIYDDSVIQAGYLYNAYMDNFVNPLNARLQEVMSSLAAASGAVSGAGGGGGGGGSYTSSTPTVVKKSTSAISTGIAAGAAAISSTANSLKSGISAGMTAGMAAAAAAMDKKKLNIGKFHGGGMVGSSREALALLRPNEVVLTPEWAEGMNKLVRQINENKFINSGSTTKIEVDGNLINMENKINNRQDADYVAEKVERVLRDKFNIKK